MSGTTTSAGNSGEPAELEWHDGDMPYSPAFGDYFYSRADGRAECAHVFIGGNDLPSRFAAGGDLTIAETGFGTGLNFTETWRHWKLTVPASARLSFVSFEKYPMQRGAIARALSAWPEIDAERTALTAAWPDDASTGVALDFGDVRLTVVAGDALASIRAWEGRADAWFLDGFAPSRNPDMWSLDLMLAIAARTAAGGSFATYTSAGWVRRNLSAAGFVVEKCAGHAGKREMCRGKLADAGESD